MSTSELPSSSGRGRPVLTCTRCRRNKLKCDRARPCRACIRTNRADSCSYQSDQPISPSPPIAMTNSLCDGYAEMPRASPPAKRRRQRAVLVCTRCKQLKQRCDQEHPCGACVRGRVEGQCTYVRWREAEQTVDSPARPAVSTSAPQPNGAEGRESTPDHLLQADLQARVAELEQRVGMLGRDPVASSCPTPRESSPHAGPSIADLAALLPPAEQCRRLVSQFLNFDLLLRHVHAPSFKRRTEALIERLPLLDEGDAPMLAILAAALLTAALASREMTRTAWLDKKLREAMNGALELCESGSGGIGKHMLCLDYVHALLLASAVHVVGQTSSPAKLWLALGKAYHAALLVGLHRDMPGETVQERELRRRLWWNIVYLKRLTADRMHIDPCMYEENPVPRPLIIADEVLDTVISAQQAHELALSPTAGYVPTPIPEWGFTDVKFDFLKLLSRRSAVLADVTVPLLDRLNAAHTMVDTFRSTPHAFLRLPARPRPGEPRWVYLQTCIMEIALDETIIQLYRPHFGNSDLGAVALSRGLEAAHRVIAVNEAFMTFLLFSWIDAPPPSLWSFSMKAFTSGMAMAYALLSSPSSSWPGSAEAQGALDTVIGLLRSLANLPGSSDTNTQALRTLEQLRVAILGGETGDTDGGLGCESVKDPFTGKVVELPFVFAGVGVDLPGEWVEWEALFRDLFQT